MERAIFLDRDGVLIFDPGHLRDESQVKLLPGIIVPLKKLTELGFKLIITSNQSAVARKYITLKEMWRIDSLVRREFRRRGVSITDSFYCPHNKNKNCSCRKPKPGLFFQAQKRCNIDFKNSFIVGDKPSDCEAGLRAGCQLAFLIPRNQKAYDLEAYSSQKVKELGIVKINDLKDVLEFVDS